MTPSEVSAEGAFAGLEGTGILAMIAAQVRRSPHAPAVSGRDGDLDYAELAARADTCAQLLSSRGIKPGEPVALRIPPSAAGICAYLGVLHAGGVLVPLDPSQPALRQEQIMVDAGVRLVVSEGPTAGTYAVTENGSAPRTLDTDAAYIIHTSGSTGRPKGVVCGHAGLANMAQAQQSVFGVQPTDRVAQLAPWCVDASVFEIALGLTAGACLQVATLDDRYPGPPLERFLTAAETTVAVATPSVLRALDPGMLTGLRLVISAGEALLPELARAWTPGRRLVNAYGPTEATIWSSYAEVSEDMPASAGSVPLGRPVPGTTLTLLDERLQPVPPGEPGEICIGGAGLAAGYLGQEDLTRERFPVGPAGRIYRTGDLAVRDDDGTVRFLGRADEQVKLGGFRVELGEVRHVLTQHPDIDDCAVRQDGNRLVAYITTRQTTPVDPYGLIQWMEDRLPIQMVPTLYLPLKTLPLTAWGKLDLAALPSIPEAMAALRNAPTPGKSPTQDYLARIAAELLDVSAISPDEDLFMLGMTSLSMAQLLRRILEDIEVEIEPVEVFENSTVIDLAAVIDERKAASS
ncbi:MAG TPA: non-ribosomal peptide synthetase [Nonomuraea sp.]|nr:non-ribosomal peptide synthetase [Nonomuraea sp.]